MVLIALSAPTAAGMVGQEVPLFEEREPTDTNADHGFAGPTIEVDITT